MLAGKAPVVKSARNAGHGFVHWFTHLGSNIGAFGVAALIVATISLVFYVVFLIITRPNRDLPDRLEPYRLHPEAVDEVSSPEGVVTVPLLRRLADVLSQLAERHGLRAALESRITRAGLSITLGELMVVTLIAAAMLIILGGVLLGLIGVLLALVISGLAPFGVLQFLADRRTRRFDAQLPDILKLLSASLRAGFSLLQGLDAVISQVGDPMAGELRRAFAATRVGVAVEDALAAVAERVGSQDFEWAVMAIRIQREVGGNLAEILDTVASTMTARVRLRREVRTLTAEGRISAIILIILPVAIGLFVWVVNRSYMETLFNTFGGNVALLGGVVLEIVGAWWLYRTVQIEI